MRIKPIFVQPFKTSQLYCSMKTDAFALRHIGPRESDVQSMLKTIGADSLDQLITETIPDDIRIKLYNSILYYGNLETSRPNVSGRFHRSCFSIPNCATNTYFCLLSTMELIENGTTTDALSIAANAKLKALGMQTWTQPYRNDATDANVVSVERFRNHVWWVGGNAIAY